MATVNPIDFYEEFPFSAIPSRKYKSISIIYIYIIYVQPPPKKLTTLVDFLDCSSAECPNLLGFRQGGRLRSLGLLLFENRLLIKKDLGPILATAACSTTVTIGGNRAARIFGAKKPMWETDENLTDPSKWVGGPNNWLFSAILVGILGLKAFLRSHIDDHAA